MRFFSTSSSQNKQKNKNFLLLSSYRHAVVARGHEDRRRPQPAGSGHAVHNGLAVLGRLLDLRPALDAPGPRGAVGRRRQQHRLGRRAKTSAAAEPRQGQHGVLVALQGRDVVALPRGAPEEHRAVVAAAGEQDAVVVAAVVVGRRKRRSEDLPDVAREAHGRGRQRRGAGHAAVGRVPLLAAAIAVARGDEGAVVLDPGSLRGGGVVVEVADVAAGGRRRREIALRFPRHVASFGSFSMHGRGRTICLWVLSPSDSGSEVWKK